MSPDRQAQDVVGGRPKKRTFRYCTECEHFFDARDKRCFIAREHGDMCPACAMSQLRGEEAWAVWNDCNGVFTDHVFANLEDAARELSVTDWAAGDRVKPVRVYVDEDDLRNMRADALRPREIPFGDDPVAPDALTFEG